MSKESTEQGKSGRRGAEAAQPNRQGDQPRQGAQRTEARSAQSEEPKHHFASGQAPSEQGEKGHPSPEVIKQHQQGLSGSGTGHQGAGGAHSDHSQETAVQGEPREEHTRSGRQDIPGDRSRQ